MPEAQSETAQGIPGASTDPAAPDQELLLKRTLVSAFLDHVPDVVYFKDRESRFIAVSKSKAARHNCPDTAQLIGKSDADFFNEVHARRAREDELAIMATGVPLVGKVEKITWADGRVSWARSSKVPLRDADGRIIGTFGITQDITAAKHMEEALEKANRELRDASRVAGMAEVATGVLHNVGNVLNSLNVSASVLASGVRNTKTTNLSKISAMLREHGENLAEYLTQDPKGRLVIEFLESLARNAEEERERFLREIDSLQKNIDHIKEIVSMQQAYATMAGVVEPLDAATLMDDGLRMNTAALLRHDVHVVRDYRPVEPVLGERGKSLQILINLIRNAKYALDEGRSAGKVLTLRIESTKPGRVSFVVEDNGVGIPHENLAKIFGHGFTTRAGGHGFGLHSSALAAKEMNGSLTVHSDGPGCGARFTLEIPVAEARDGRHQSAAALNRKNDGDRPNLS